MNLHAMDEKYIYTLCNNITMQFNVIILQSDVKHFSVTNLFGSLCLLKSLQGVHKDHNNNYFVSRVIESKF